MASKKTDETVKEEKVKKEGTKKSTTKTKKTNVKEEVKKEIQPNDIDLTEVKSELTDYMKMQINKEVSMAVDKATKKLVRHKNLIIIRRDIFIVILLGVCILLGYNLYTQTGINIDITKEKSKVEEKVETKKEEVEEETTIENLIKKYEYLIENIGIDEESSYLKKYYRGELTDDIKLYIALNNLDEDKIVSEGDNVYVDEEDLKESYTNIFDGDFAAKSFKYGDLNFHYLLFKKMFFASGKYEKKDSNITKVITNIEEKDDEINITTTEGILLDDKLYNIISNEQIKQYNSKDNLKSYSKDLTNVVYHFSKDNDTYKLTKIEII